MGQKPARNVEPISPETARKGHIARHEKANCVARAQAPKGPAHGSPFGVRIIAKDNRAVPRQMRDQTGQPPQAGGIAKHQEPI